MRVAVVGQGYVGLTIAVEAAKSGHNVVGFDINADLVDRLNNWDSHIEGISDEELKTLFGSGNLMISSTPSAISGAEVVVIAVPTPLDEKRNPDTSFLDAACQTIAANLSQSALIINESTSFPGTLRNLIAGSIAKMSSPDLVHLYAASPERVDPGNTEWGQKRTPRLLAGLTPEATARAREFYSAFCENLVEVSSPEVAEAAKLFENTFRQVNIALVNEFAQIAHALGIPSREVIDAASTKPYGFMPFSPGPGVGGHCIPVDPSYLASVAEAAGVPATFIRRANEVNMKMPAYVVSRVKEDLGGLAGKKVIVVGVSYKTNVADTRETPAELIINELKKDGAIVSWHDPLVEKWRGEISSPLNANAADAAIVVTKHDAINAKDVLLSAAYVFDCTGKIGGVPSI
ncbi:MAG TPA: nucleotide sugar dehydrogenase [Candidatus Nanopelagicaceae bacterium]